MFQHSDSQNHPNNILLSYLSINSLRYKITHLRILVYLPHYLVVSEAKLNEEFASAQFLMSDYEVKSRKDGNKNGMSTGIYQNRSNLPNNDTI